MKRRIWVGLGAALLVGGGVLATQNTIAAYAEVSNQQQERPELLKEGTTAPDFTATDANGKAVKLSDFKGKVVVLDFWASWCPPCVRSMPHNEKVTKKLQDEKLPVVLLAVDNSEPREPFLKWVKEHPEFKSLTFVHADRKEVSIAGKMYNVSGIPTQYIIDTNGVIRASFVGFGKEDDKLENAVRAALKPLPTEKGDKAAQ